ncbi:MAG: GNAT family N-acetyltransferase [Sphingobacteriales bacterium JAD_PAG50586_3]|nr:MAG: GNAT family N-acetyltransferase [Sphingobacteriales bacterium JAD_PAG50586_3]
MQSLPFTVADLPLLSTLQPPDWQDITPHYEYYLNSPQCSPIKIMEGNTMVGVGATIRHKDTAWLAHIVTHPGHRKKGVGAFITQSLVDILADFETIYLVATPMGQPVYRKLGFVEEMNYVWLQGEPQQLEYDTTYIRPLEEKDKTVVYNFDIDTFGEDRITRLSQHWEKALVWDENGTIEGYYFPTMGEGVIVANNPTVGLHFIKLRLKTNGLTIIPLVNTAVHEFLKGLNYKETITAKRMRLGKERAWKPEKIYNRVSGQIG